MSQLKEGDEAPHFEMPDQEGRMWKLDDLKGQRVILYFYPADDTPGCTKQACDFRDSQHGLQAAGYTVLGVSPQDADSHQGFREKYSLNFPLLIDEGLGVAKAYGAVRTSGLFKGGVNRSTFVIDEDGKIAHALYGVRATGHVAKLKEALGVAA